MKVLLVIMLIILLALSGCTTENRVAEKVPNEVASSAPEIIADESEPMLMAGEKLYGDWLYTFLDLDGNDYAERISFTYVVKNPDNENSITARIAIEYDFATKNSYKDPLFIERAADSLITPKELYASQTDDGALIIIKDTLAACGEDMYAFKYKTGELSELHNTESQRFPENAMSKAYIFNSTEYTVSKSDESTLSIKIRDEQFAFEPELGEGLELSDSYVLRFNTNDLIMSYEPESMTLLFGAAGTLSASSSDMIIQIKALITLKYRDGNFRITDIALSNGN